MGKTAFALTVAAHAAMEAQHPVLFFSLEMSHSEITQRLLCAEARVDATRMRNGRLLEADWPKITHALGRLGEAPLYIDDNPNLLRADNGEEVTLGQLVLSQEQPLVWSLDDRWRMVPRRLIKAFPSGIKPVFRLRLASGYEVEASANHPFRTVDGWRRLDQ